jgi:competence protein ComGF
MKKDMKHVHTINKCLQGNTGHTLVEVIIALAVIVMITSLFPLLLIPIQKHPPITQLEETSLFFSMIGKEIREAKAIEVNNNTLYITNANQDVISFSKYHSLIRKQVNGLGHEVWVQNVHSIVMEMAKDILLTVTITNNDGLKMQRVFRRIE